MKISGRAGVNRECLAYTGWAGDRGGPASLARRTCLYCLYSQSRPSRQLCRRKTLPGSEKHTQQPPRRENNDRCPILLALGFALLLPLGRFSSCCLFSFAVKTGELFYVETDIHEDSQNANRHDHGHLGGVSLEVITQSMAARKPGQTFKSESIAETEATSRSSSQDSGNTDNAWQSCPQGTYPAQAEVSAPDPFAPKISLKEACEWDFSKLEDAGMERRSRERSFSEPQLHRCLNQQQQQRVPQIQRLEWFTPPGHLPRDNHQLGTVVEGNASATGDGFGRSSGGARRRNSLNPGQSQSFRENGPEGDMCARTAISLQRAWGFVFGGEAFKNHGRIEGVSRHLFSCTSTKTFEVSSSECDRDALARLGVVPDTDHGFGGAASMTFTMHIAGHR